jgi:hypothetical protein
MEIWTVEPCKDGWAVVNDDGECIRSFPTDEGATDWLALKQEETEMNALASYTMDGEAMTTRQEVRTDVARRIRDGIVQVYSVGEWFSDSTMQEVDDAIVDLWRAFGFQMIACPGCRMRVPEVRMTQQQGRSYCPECRRPRPGYSTIGTRRLQPRIRSRRQL